MSDSTYLDAVTSRIVIFDGAAGTWLQTQDLSVEDYGTPDLEGCPEILNETRPELIKRMHSEYFEAGADIVETNSFGGMRATLNEYGLGDRAEELNDVTGQNGGQRTDVDQPWNDTRHRHAGIRDKYSDDSDKKKP